MLNVIRDDFFIDLTVRLEGRKRCGNKTLERQNFCDFFRSHRKTEAGATLVRKKVREEKCDAYDQLFS
ncbi:hypothetical protein X975_00458, partial [Stegodyphus mimosarum]